MLRFIEPQKLHDRDGDAGEKQSQCRGYTIECTQLEAQNSNDTGEEHPHRVGKLGDLLGLFGIAGRPLHGKAQQNEIKNRKAGADRRTQPYRSIQPAQQRKDRQLHRGAGHRTDGDMPDFP